MEHLDEEKQDKRPKRGFCKNCAVYLDGHKMAHDDGSIVFSGMGGMMFIRRSSGSVWERIGFYTPCTCQDGQAVGSAYLTSATFNTVNKFRNMRNRGIEHTSYDMIFSDMIEDVDKNNP
jgi:hypothetical protein